ncbi:VENN motif pre-toxin domain-containing protein, partial [Proteus sp. TJ1640]|uniref:VENN motif pre-toxin domain-containing protein n=1 Tax=Proteus sp. TJ1640 TaxID=2050968 RepID=UPI0013A59316
TDTLGWKDIDNKADFTAEHTGGSIGTDGPIGSQLVTNAAGGLLSNANNSGHAEGTTQSAVSDGSVIVRNEDKQKQDINKLNRDTEHANDGSINPIFDKEKEQNRLKQAQLIGEIGNQTMDIIRTEGDIAGYKAQKDPDALAIAKKQLEAAGKTPTEQAIKDQAYNNAMAQYGTGSDFQKAAQAVTGLLQGLAGDNLAGALASASSPYLATKIKELTTDPATGEVNKATNAMAHAVLGAVVAELNNQSAAAGGLGAGGGELAARYITKELFPNKDVSELTEREKQQVSALSQLASGLAGGLTTGDMAGAVTAAQAGKNAVENNAFNLAGRKQKDIESSIQKQVDGIDLDAVYGDDQNKKDAYRKGREQGAKDGLKDGISESIEGTINTILNPIDAVTDLTTAIWNYDKTYDAIKISVTEWNQLYEYALVNDPELAGQMVGSLQGKMLGNIGTSVVVSGAAAKTIQKVAQMESGIKWLPDAHGKTHATIVKGDAAIPVDKIELYLRGKASGDLTTLKADYNALKDLQVKNQSQFAKDPNNFDKLRILESKIHNVEKSRDMNKVLNNAGIPDTPLNNSMIINELLKSANDVTATNRRTSIVINGSKGNVRVYGTWTILPDGSKRLSTVEAGAFK